MALTKDEVASRLEQLISRWTPGRRSSLDYAATSALGGDAEAAYERDLAKDDLARDFCDDLRTLLAEVKS